MQLGDLSKPGEKKKLLAAAALGLGAIIVLWWALFGFGSNNTRPTRTTASATPAPRNTTSRPQQQAPAPEVQSLANFAPVEYVQSSYSAPEPKRNIFSYYEPPKQPIVEKPTP